MPTLLWYPYCLYYYYILTKFVILVPALLWYMECLSYSYIHSAYLIMIFIKNSKKKLICAFFITIYRVPALLLYVECLLYYNLPFICTSILSKLGWSSFEEVLSWNLFFQNAFSYNLGKNLEIYFSTNFSYFLSTFHFALLLWRS